MLRSSLLVSVTIAVFLASLAAASAQDALVAPEAYDHLVPRVQWPQRDFFSNLYYEGNNMSMRGDRSDDGLYLEDGPSVAQHWRSWAVGVRGIFVLRDSLYSQQDHPFHHRPHALILPPNYITTVLAEMAAGREAVPPAYFDADDDSAWTALSAESFFGSFPHSESLYEQVTTSLMGASDAQVSRTRNARATVGVLRGYAEALIEASREGEDAVVRLGAEAVALSDRTYFGDEVRRDHIIPLLVENPLPHELDEGKGFTILGRDDVTDAMVDRARTALLRRRLEDGDVAVERYEISIPDERARAVNVLQGLIPRGDTPEGGTVWLWVTGPIQNDDYRDRDSPLPWLGNLQAEIAGADIDTTRLRILVRPVVSVVTSGWDDDAVIERVAQRLSVDARTYRGLGLPMCVNLRTGPLQRLLDQL